MKLNNPTFHSSSIWDSHISSLVEELDFEAEANTSTHEEDLGIMKGTNTSLVEELIHDVNAIAVNEKEPIALKDAISNLCDLTELQQSQTETRGKENENLIDLEDGEISDSGSVKKNDNKMCKFFKRGSCFYGSRCQFLHISDKVYKMFDTVFSYEKSLKENVPCVSKVENSCYTQDIKSPWEKGLENAKAIIQKSISKRMDDIEFENKKMYISSSSGTIDVPDERDLALKSMEESKFIPIYKTEPLKENPHRYGRTMKTKSSVSKSSFYNVKIPHHEYKWVDPWMRSKSPNRRKIYKLCSTKDYSDELCCSSSSSSIGHDGKSSQGKKLYKRKLPASPLNIKHSRSRSNSRSLSRSASRTISRSRSWSCSSCSRSSSDSLHSLYKKPIKKSGSNKVFPVAKRTPRKRRSTSLEKWYKSQHRTSSASRNSTHSSMFSIHKSPGSVLYKCNSDNESWSSMTVSSISCSNSSSDSLSNQSKSKMRNGLSNTLLRNTTENKNSSHLQRKTSLSSGEFGKNKSTPIHADVSVYKERTSYKNSPERLSKTCVTRNPSSCFNTKNTTSQHITSLKPLPKLSSNPSLIKESTKNQFSSTANTLLKYRTLNNCFNEATVSKHKNLVDFAKESGSAPTPQSNKTTNTHDSTKSGFLAKRTITLNLQPKSQKLVKLSEVPHKKQDTTETVYNSEKMAISKRKILLKQLKLVEDAIAKKMGCQS